MNLALLALCVSALEPMGADRAQASVSLGFGTYSSQPSTIGFSDSARVRIDAIWVSMQAIQLRPATSCKRASAKVLIEGPVTTELVQRRAKGLPATAKIDVGRYCALELTLRRSGGKATGAPSELRGASIVVQGRRSDGVRVVLRSRIEISPMLRAHDLEGLAIEEAGARWILAADMARWMTGIDLALADVGNDGVMRIDETSNPELLTKFNANVETGFSLFIDKDGDRSLDSNEHAKPIASGRCSS